HIDVTIATRRAAQNRSRVPAGDFETFELSHHVDVALSTGEHHTGDAKTFVSSNLGIVRGVGARTGTLRSFKPHMPVPATSLPPPPRAPKAATAAVPAPRSDCTCEPCADQWLGGKKCVECKLCDCYPDSCFCTGKPCDVQPDPDCEATCVRKGSPGVVEESCPRRARLLYDMLAAEACREAYWDSGVGTILSGLGIYDPNDVCGRSLGDDAGWEQKGEADIVGIVGGTRSPADECEADPPLLRCEEGEKCPSVLRSSIDNCITH